MTKQSIKQLSRQDVIVIVIVIEESNKESMVLVCFCLGPLSQTYHMHLSSITIILYVKEIFEKWRQIVSKSEESFSSL